MRKIGLLSKSGFYKDVGGQYNKSAVWICSEYFPLAPANVYVELSSAKPNCVFDGQLNFILSNSQ